MLSCLTKFRSLAASGAAADLKSIGSSSYKARFIVPRHLSIATNGSQLIFDEKQNHSGHFITSNINKCYSRQLFSDRSVRPRNFDKLELAKLSNYGSRRDEYFKLLKERFESGHKNAICRDDLGTLICLAETEDHVDLIEKVAKEYDQDGSWGMALLYLYTKLNLFDRVYAKMKDPSYGKFFTGGIGQYRSAMITLFKLGRFSEVIDLFNDSCKNIPDGKNVSLKLLAVASHAKLNSEQSCDEVEKILTTIKQDRELVNLVVGQRSFIIGAYLQVKNERYSKALDTLSYIRRSRSLLPGSIELRRQCWVKMDREKEFVVELRQYQVQGQNKPKLLQPTLDELRNILEKDLEPQDSRFLEGFLKDYVSDYLTLRMSLEDFLFRPVDTRDERSFDLNRPRARGFYNVGYDRGNYRNQLGNQRQHGRDGGLGRPYEFRPRNQRFDFGDRVRSEASGFDDEDYQPRSRRRDYFEEPDADEFTSSRAER